MKSLPVYLVCVALFGLSLDTYAQRVRREPYFPDISGYVTLKCDFHMHTVFSDGSVWPPVRVDEAWSEGYDAMALTEHFEYLPHKQDMVLTNYNRPYDLARPAAESLGLILIRAGEITRGEPPGHWNALFLTNLNRIPTNEHRAAMRAAREQQAFVFWNHPGWKQPDGKAKWYKEQQEALDNGWLHGLEIVNGNDYDPIVHQWCIDRKLTLLGNSDVHGPVGLDYVYPPGTHRPVTLVFAWERTAGAIREALFARRTAVWMENTLYGDAEYLRPLFDKSLDIRNPTLSIAPKGRAVLQIHNRSAVDFDLRAKGKVAGITFPQKLKLYAGRTMAVEIRRTAAEQKPVANMELPYEAQNLVPEPDKPLPVTIRFTLKAQPVK